MAGSDRALTAVSRRARLTRSRVATAATPATITMSRHQDAEADDPAGGMVMEQAAHAGEKGEQAQQQDGHEGDGEQPELADDLAVEEAGTDELGDVPVEALHVLEQGPGRLPRLELGEQVADHVVAERCVDRRPRVLEGVVRIGLVAVDDPDPLDAAVGVDE